MDLVLQNMPSGNPLLAWDPLIPRHPIWLPACEYSSTLVGCGMHVSQQHAGSPRQELHMHTYPRTCCPGSNAQGAALWIAPFHGFLSQMRDMPQHSAKEHLLCACRIPRD